MSAEEALARKKKVRSTQRSSATRLMCQDDILVKGTPVDTNGLTLLLTNLSTKLTALEALNAEIVELTPEAQLEEEIGRADEYSEKIQRALLQICKALKTPTPPVIPPLEPSSDTSISHGLTFQDLPSDNPDISPHPPSSGSDRSTAGGSVVISSQVKLPKISLPHFKWNLIYWTAFWDSYESAVHLNSARFIWCRQV